MHFPILSILILLPFFGVLVLSIIRGQDEIVSRNAKNVALLITTINFILSLYLLYQFEYHYTGMQFEEIYPWISAFEANIHFGIDGLSVYFIVLTNLLMPICILASWTQIKNRIRPYLMCFLFLQSMLLGTFCSLNLILFYICFEATLIPMFFIIGIWGGEDRIYASFKLFLYTLFGSIFMLLAILKVFIETGETNFLLLQNYDWHLHLDRILFLGFFIAFAIKIPMWPVHTWLPIAHTQAPTAGSVILAGVLLKLGAYGMIRICLPLFPNASIYFSEYIIILSVIAILYMSVVALAQTDMKKLIAYSSVAHMGFVTLGIFSFTPQGLSGAVVQMLSHGIISAGLFLCIGVLYDRFHTREIKDYGGLFQSMPRFSILFLTLLLGSAGLPGTFGFLGEITVIIGTFRRFPNIAFLSAMGMILSAAYGLWLYRRLCLGPESEAVKKIPSSGIDVTKNERFNLSILVIISLYFGVYAQPLFGIINPFVKKIEGIFKPRFVKQFEGDDDILIISKQKDVKSVINNS
ncbi:MAG: NADH-quinone oxidoreductase subunit M [Alphaproteobacteria bacterium CG_4_10_14_0_8_um_filter_37_21]|nr:MAG: NADH-quinone oxidoreductase subunit M [Alphaproteobacteria bacterium CG_4_10_14_0_8_um_filter_37_21]